MNNLTSEQERVFSFINAYRQETGFPPTVREIALQLGYKSPNNVRQHLRLIERKGYIRVNPGKARGLEIIAGYAEESSDEGVMVPIVGAVAAGKPITAIENLDGYITLDKSIFKGDGLFALRIRGDSMQGIGVLDSDIVVIRQKATAENNEVVVVIIDGDATLKRFISQDGKVLLRAENPAYADIELSSKESIQIAGKLVGVIRKY